MQYYQSRWETSINNRTKSETCGGLTCCKWGVTKSSLNAERIVGGHIARKSVESNERTYETHIFYILPWNASFTAEWAPISFMYSGVVKFPNWPHGCKHKFVVCDHKPCLPISVQVSNVESQYDFHNLCYCWFGSQHWKVEWMCLSGLIRTFFIG